MNSFPAGLFFTLSKGSLVHLTDRIKQETNLQRVVLFCVLSLFIGIALIGSLKAFEIAYAAVNWTAQGIRET